MSDPVNTSHDRPRQIGAFESFCYLLLLMIPLVTIASCTLGGGDNEITKRPPASKADAKVSSDAFHVKPHEVAKPVERASEPRGSNMLEQAILDAFPASKPRSKSAIANSRNAADFVGATINQAGQFCARPIEALAVAAGQYGISCKKYREGYARANYIVDVRTGSVDEI